MKKIYQNTIMNGIKPYYVMYNGQKYNAAYFDDELMFGYIEMSNSGPFYVENPNDTDIVISINKNDDSARTLSFYYSTDAINWNVWGDTSTAGLSITVSPNSKLYIKTSNESDGRMADVPSGSWVEYYHYFKSTGKCNIGENIFSLVWNRFSVVYKTSSYAFAYLFSGDSNIINANKLVLPATTLAANCYEGMFKECKSLTTAPELPATTLAESCYKQLFYQCKALTTAPTLPATTLADYCYQFMFYYCTSLTTVPELPATTLAYGCYRSMFTGCKSLTTAPELPATTLAENCYNDMFSVCTSLTTAPVLPVTDLMDYCYQGMFSGCTSLTKTPVLPATTLADSCYMEMFSNCQSLTTAPVLPATTLAKGCYHSMFYGCSNLNYVKCLATDISATSCVVSMLSGVAETGTFVCAKGMTSTWRNSNAQIPSGWTIVEVDE